MCGPGIPGQELPKRISRRDASFTSEGRVREAGGLVSGVRPGFEGLKRDLGDIVSETGKQRAEGVAVRETTRERKRKQKSGGRQSTILAGAGVARESRRRSLLTAANAEEQRKTLLGQ